MLRHCTIEELLEIRDGSGSQALRRHLDECAACRAELEGLHQRVAMLKALPSMMPPRDRWGVVRQAVVSERRRRRWARTGWAGLAAAAVLVLAVAVRSGGGEDPAVAEAAPQIENLIQQSRQLEAALRSMQPKRRVVNGYTASTIVGLEDRIAAVDLGIETAQRGEVSLLQLRDLWEERVALMGTLVNTAGQRTAYVGF